MSEHIEYANSERRGGGEFPAHWGEAPDTSSSNRTNWIKLNVTRDAGQREEQR